MKSRLFAIASTVATLVGCTSGLEPIQEQVGEGIFATIEQPGKPVQTKGFTWDNALKFKWDKNENLVVFGNKDAALLRTLTAGESSSQIESKGFQLMEEVNYYAFIPAYSFNITTTSDAIPVTFLGQRQTANNNTAHLKFFDYACASATKEAGSNSLGFTLKNQVAWIVLEHYFSDEVKGVTSITLSTSEKLFTTKCTLDATKQTLKYNKLATELSLNLGAENGSGLDFAKGEYLRAFFTTAPVDLSDKEITITAHKADGTSLVLGTKTIPECNIEKNATIVLRTSGTNPAAIVASLDGKQFSSLDDAIAAAENYGKQSTITLTGDVIGSFTITNPMSIGKEIILDLNGHSITAENEGESAIIVKQGDVRLKNGNIESKNFVGVKFDPQSKGARVYLVDCNVNSDQGAVCTSTATGCQIVIYGGSFTATNNAVIAGNGSPKYAGTQEARDKGNTIIISADSKGNVPVFNGSVVDADAVACGLYSPWKDEITINAAKFNVENGVGILCRGGKITVNDAEISVTGGGRTGKVADGKTDVPCKTFYKDFNCGYPDIENADIDIKGGKYSDDAGKPYVADNSYSYVETGETPLAYKVVTNETKFTEAVSNVEKDGTVIIDYPVSLRNQLKIQKDFTLTLSEGANIQGDCKSPVLHFCQDGGNNTINGKGVIYGGTNSDAAILVNGQTLTIGCENENDIHITGGNSSDFASAITIWDGKLVINNGTFISGTDASGNDSPAIYLMPMDQYDAPELEINGGVFCPAISSSGSAKFLINCYDPDIARCKITIKGGTFIGFNPAASTGDNIDGKPANWVADGYESVESKEEPGTWIVQKKKI